MDESDQQQRRWLTTAEADAADRQVRGLRGATCDVVLPLLRSYLSEALVSELAFERLVSPARFFPSSCLGALELRLAASRTDVDLAFRLDHSAQARAVAEHLETPHLVRFLLQWAHKERIWAPVRAIWLEFDLDSAEVELAARGLPEPVVIAELGEQPSVDWLLDALVPALDGSPPSAQRRRLLAGSLGALPPGSHLLYVFGLRARQRAASRFEIERTDDRVDLGTIVSGLRPFVGHETADRVDGLLPLIADCDRFHLSFDIGDTIDPAVGLEASFRRLPHREPGWKRMVDRLVGSGLCAAEKAEALWRWPGWSSPATDRGAWPEAYSQPGVFMARCLSHIKLVSRPGEAPEAKAYLLFEALDKRTAG